MMEADQANNNDDVMSRRLKNRERQRRYRARKRLEADKKKAGNIANPSAPVPLLVDMQIEHVEANKKPCNAASISAASAPAQVQTQTNGFSNGFVTRIHCRRDWKKDARMAQRMKEQQNALGGDFSSCNGTQVGLVQSVAETLAPTDSGLHMNNIERSVTPGRRRWKADARNRVTPV